MPQRVQGLSETWRGYGFGPNHSDASSFSGVCHNWDFATNTVREFYAGLPTPVMVGLEATGSKGWFPQMLEELGITYRVGHPATIRKAETRQQKHDRRDAALLLQLLAENRFPTIWMPSTELRDLRALLLHRHQWVRLRTRVQNAWHASRWVMACSADTRCGIEMAKRCWHRCRCQRTPPIVAMSSRRCLITWTNKSIGSTIE